MAVAKGTHCSRSNPALVGTRAIWANTDQKERVCAGTRNGTECSGKICIALRAERHWRRGENGLIGAARVANQRALNLINWSWSAGGIATIQYESVDVEGDMSGRKIDTSPSAERAPRSGPGVDSPYRIVIGYGDITDDCFPSNDRSSLSWANAPMAQQSTANKANIFFM
jgi:hypothetical protein